MKNTIYALKDPREPDRVRYVGVTRQTMAQRMTGHVAGARKGGNWPIHRWIRKLLADGVRPVSEVIEITEDRHREAYWIAHFINSGVKLLNCAEVAGENIRFSADTRQKVSAASRACERTPEWKGRIAAALKEHYAREPAGPRTAAHRARISAALKGKPKSPEHVAKVAERRRGCKHSDEAKAKMAAAARRRKYAPRQKKPLCHKGHPKVMRSNGDWVCNICAREWAQSHYCPAKQAEWYQANREKHRATCAASKARKKAKQANPPSAPASS